MGCPASAGHDQDTRGAAVNRSRLQPAGAKLGEGREARDATYRYRAGCALNLATRRAAVRNAVIFACVHHHDFLNLCACARSGSVTPRATGARTVELTPAATTAVRRWDERRRELGPPAGQQSLAPGEWPLFVTIGRRRRDGSYTRLGERPTRKVVDLLLKQLGGRAEIAEDLRHAHVLRHTFATRYYRRTGRLAELQRLLGQEDPKTTMVYVHDDPAERERLCCGEHQVTDRRGRALVRAEIGGVQRDCPVGQGGRQGDRVGRVGGSQRLRAHRLAVQRERDRERLASHG